MGGVLSRGSHGGASSQPRGPQAAARAPARAGGKDAAALLGEVLSAAIATGFLVWGLKITLSYMDPYREGRKEAKRQAAALRQRLGRNIELNEYEMLLASNVLNPAVIDVRLDDIGGLEAIKEEMRLKVLRPLSEPGTFCTTLWRPVKGVLFYGPPGTGKTMLAKSLAAESHCFFLNVTASTVMSKWFGDANRFIRAIFTLAAKLQPCVVFIDEVDAFLTKRGASSEHEATLQAKTEFMQLWDGMEGARGSRVLVMGATNRPWMVDEAVLRRFALQYEIGLPTPSERGAILRNYLMRHQADTLLLRREGRLGEGEGGVDLELLLERLPPSSAGGAAGANGTTSTSGSTPPNPNSLAAVAAATEGYSGSDLMELAAQAAQDVLVEHWGRGSAGKLRQLTAADLVAAAGRIRPGASRALEYHGASSSQQGMRSSGGGGDGLGGGGGMAQLVAAAASAAAAAAADKQQRGGNGSRRGGTDPGGSGGDADVSEAAAAAAADEVYKLVGRMVLNGMMAPQ